MGTREPVVAPVVVRMRPNQQWWWKHPIFWRKGPETSDGFWLIHKLGYPTMAVRVVEDAEAPIRTAREFDEVLREAVHHDEWTAQDDALRRLSEVTPSELLRMREAVVAGRAGGAADGTPRRRAGKVVTA